MSIRALLLSAVPLLLLGCQARDRALGRARPTGGALDPSPAGSSTWHVFADRAQLFGFGAATLLIVLSVFINGRTRVAAVTSALMAFGGSLAADIATTPLVRFLFQAMTVSAAIIATALMAGWLLALRKRHRGT